MSFKVMNHICPDDRLIKTSSACMNKHKQIRKNHNAHIAITNYKQALY